MIDLFQVYEELSPSLGEESARVLTKTLSRIYEDVRQTVTKAEFRELTAIVGELASAQKELAAAQKRTEERLDALALRVDSLAARMEELAAAQKRTEERVDSLAARMEELAAAQKRTEERLDALALRVDSLAARMEELAAAQKRTEERVDSLAARMEELAAAQKRTEDALLLLTKRVDRLEERVEGISHSVGYVLENSAYRGLPALLARHGIEVHGRLVRRYLGEYQVNILGQGTRAGTPVTIVGECKVRPSRKEVDRFLKVVTRLEHEGLVRAPVVVFVGHDFHPTVERYLEDKGILWFWSYELE